MVRIAPELRQIAQSNYEAQHPCRSGMVIPEANNADHFRAASGFSF
jgi:hypothetical protein